MSSINDKLQRLHQSRIRALDAATPEDGQNRIFTADDVPDSVGITSSPTSLSPESGFEVRERVWKAEHRHGRYTVGELSFAGFPQTFGGQLSLLADFGAADIGFFDIETTGLEADALSYCIGLGVWDGRDFKLKQWVLHDVSAEADVLRDFALALQDLVGIVSFNGRSFDAPRILARCERHKISDPFSHLIHLDLLHIARRLMPRQSVIDLQSLEKKLLMHHRHGDIPGSESPRLWRLFQGSGDVGKIKPIVEHNGVDILSLSGILHHFRQVDAEQLPAQKPDEVAFFALTPTTDLQRQLQRTLERPKRIVVRRAADRLPPSAPTPVTSSSTPAPSNKESFGKKLEALRHRYNTELRQGDLKSGVQTLHELLAISPTHAFALQHLARYYESQGEHALAQNFLERLKALGIS